MASKWVNEIPIRITALKRREKNFTIKEKKAMGVCGTSWAILSLFEIRLATTVADTRCTIGVSILFILHTLIFIRLFLKMYFDEHELYTRYQKEKGSSLIGVEEEWDILYIDKNGVIVTKDNVSGGYNKSVLVMLERSNTIGRQPDFEIVHYENVTKFIRLLLSRGYKLRKYNLAINDTNEKAFDNSLGSRNSLTNIRLKNTINSIINYNKECVRKVQNRTIEYYRIEGCGMTDRLLSDVDEAIRFLSQTIYKPLICDKQLFIEFLYKYYKQPFIDVKSLFKKNLPAEKLLEVVSKTDKHKSESIFTLLDGKIESEVEEYKRKRQKVLEGIDNAT